MSKSFWLVSAGMFALATTPAYAHDQTSPTGETSPVEQAGEVDAQTDVAETAKVEQHPRMEGRQMLMVLAPK